MFVCTPIELTLMIWPDLRSRITGSSLRISRTAPEVVELDRALEVVRAVVGERDRAPDRAAGVVDQDVDVAVLGEHLLGHPVDVVEVGEVARWMWATPPPASIWSRVASSFSGVRATSSTVPPASAIFIAADLPIPDEAPVTITIRPRTAASSETLPTQAAPEAHQLVGDLLLDDLGEPADQAEPPARGADQGPVAEQVGVEVALPVVPELARVGLQRRHGDPGALERRLRSGASRSGSGS